MTQSVELLLDPAAELVVREEWHALQDAGLPSEVRSTPSPSHCPHITLYAGPEITPDTDRVLSGLVAGLGLQVQLGALMLFGPHRGGYVLVHAVVPSIALLELQRDVARVCGAEHTSYFAPGRWAGHVTVARRMRPEQLAAALSVLATGGGEGQPMEISRCRRWDGTARRDWLL